VAAVLSGAGPSVLALTNGAELPAQVVEFAEEHGFTAAEVAVGDPVCWSADVTVAPQENRR
jgi:homoserine kinase